MFRQKLWQRCLLCLLILFLIWATKKIDLPITRQLVRTIDKEINQQYDYLVLWQEAKKNPLVMTICKEENWLALGKLAQIRLSLREREEKPVFLDLERQ